LENTLDLNKRIGILSTGDMGHSVGRALIKNGHEVITSLRERSSYSRELAEVAGIKNVGNLSSVIQQSHLILSILPPSAAFGLAEKLSVLIRSSQNKPVVVDCNAISPETACSIGKIITSSGSLFIDAGIIGLAPGKEQGDGPRFYVSGPDVTIMMTLDGCGFRVISLGLEIGRASGIKMCYAGLTKGMMTLHTAVLIVAEKLGLSEDLISELSFSQADALSQMEKRVPRLPADSKRWIGEMEQIAETFDHVGVTVKFHEAAAEIFKLLASTPFANETRLTMNLDRGLSESVALYSEHLSKKKTN